MRKINLGKWNFLVMRFMLAIMICCVWGVTENCIITYADYRVEEANQEWQVKYNTLLESTATVMDEMNSQNRLDRMEIIQMAIDATMEYYIEK